MKETRQRKKWMEINKYIVNYNIYNETTKENKVIAKNDIRL